MKSLLSSGSSWSCRVTDTLCHPARGEQSSAAPRRRSCPVFRSQPALQRRGYGRTLQDVGGLCHWEKAGKVLEPVPLRSAGQVRPAWWALHPCLLCQVRIQPSVHDHNMPMLEAVVKVPQPLSKQPLTHRWSVQMVSAIQDRGRLACQ